jgi:hypothetical protein
MFMSSWKLAFNRSLEGLKKILLLRVYPSSSFSRIPNRGTPPITMVVRLLPRVHPGGLPPRPGGRVLYPSGHSRVRSKMKIQCSVWLHFSACCSSAVHFCLAAWFGSGQSLSFLCICIKKKGSGSIRFFPPRMRPHITTGPGPFNCAR